jgi:hypothetical protein
MTIKGSRTHEVAALIAALGSDDEVKRESAIARLAIIGPRAMDRLLAAYATADRDARLGMLRAMEAIADPRAVTPAVEALSSGGSMARAATGVLRTLLDSPAVNCATQALDALVATALDPTAERSVRTAAFDAIQEMPARIREPVAAALQTDADLAIRARASEAPRDAAADDAVWQDALDGRLPENPAALRESIRSRAASAPLSTIQKLLDAVRVHEDTIASTSRREGWLQVRGALHQALALRGSRIAIYDLRETIAAADRPLPANFLTAVHAVGDASCLEPIAAAWSRSSEETARHQLAAAFDAVIKREKISRRSAVLKRIASRWPGIS